MADSGPTKADINAVFKRLRSNHSNKQCFDCGAMNPTWASVTYGVFLCIDCSAVHRSLGVHLTFIRSTQLDTNWTWLQLRAMQLGGNAAALGFFSQHGCNTNDAQQKYNSRAAHMYREKLHSQALKALKAHGTKLHVHTHTSSEADPLTSPSPTTKEGDFFRDHGTRLSIGEEALIDLPVSNGSAMPITDGEGPSVDAALSTSPTTAAASLQDRKPTIGTRKPAAVKKTNKLGGKKGGLGAQKVKADFKQLETEAQRKDKQREEMTANLLAQDAASEQDEEKRLASMRLAYQDLSLDRKKEQEKLSKLDPKKAEQMERLGMGMTGARGVSHSVVTDMKTIEQEVPSVSRDRDPFSRSREPEDDFEIIGNFGTYSSGPPKYDSPFGLKSEDRYSSWGRSGGKTSSWDTEERFESKSTSWDRFDSKNSTIEDIPTKEKDDRGRSRKHFDVGTSEEAQKKFGNAKAISSDQFLTGKDPDFETRQNLSRFEGKSSISSAEFYGNGSGAQSRSSYGVSGTDMADIKEGVRQGVTKVAGKLSSLANGMITSIQDHYG